MRVINYNEDDKNIYSPRQVLDFISRRLRDVIELHCDGTFSDEDVVELCQVLRSNPADTNMRALYLPNNNLSIASAKAIGSLLYANTTLRTLDLENNSLGCDGVDQIVQPLVSHNSTLQVLNLRSNKLSHKAAGSIGTMLRQNNTLEHLNLNHNDIGGKANKGLKMLAPKVPKKLLSLHLAHNHLKARGVQLLAAELQEHEHNLEFLDLSCNQLGSKGMISLCEWLLVRQERSLRHLWLGSNDFGAHCGSMWGSIFEYNSSLVEIKLGGNKLGDAGVVALSHGLESNHTLQRLELDWNQISDAGGEALAKSLRKNGNLKVLDLSGNQVALRGCIALSKALPYHLELRELNMRKNRMNDFAADAFINLLRERHCVLDILHWEDNDNLSNETILDLQNVMQFRKNLKKWFKPEFTDMLQNNKIAFLNWMDKDGISDFEVMKLSSLLIAAPSTQLLTVMYLGGKNIRARGIEALSEWIGSESCCLRSLFVRTTCMGDAGARAIADALETNTSLRDLSLTGSNITGIGASFLGHALVQHESLLRLNLANNRISVKGLVALATGIQHSMTLVALNVSSNKLCIPMHSEVWDELVKTSICELYLCDNELNDSVIIDFVHSLRDQCPFKIVNFVDNKITEKGAWLLFKLLEDYKVKFLY